MSAQERNLWLLAEGDNMMCGGKQTFLAMLNQSRRDVEQAISLARVWERVLERIAG